MNFNVTKQLIVFIILLLLICISHNYFEIKHTIIQKLLSMFNKILNFIKSEKSFWILIPLVAFLCINIIIIYLEKYISIESKLDTKDFQIVICTIIPTICVAFFQYESTNNIKQIEENNHISEMQSERLRSILGISTIKGKSLNFLLSETETNSEYYNIKINNPLDIYYICIECNKTLYFYPEFLKIEKSNIKEFIVRNEENTKIIDNNNNYTYILEPQKLEFHFYETSKNALIEFFKSPADIRKDKRVFHSIYIKMEIFAEDETVYINNNNRKDYLKINFELEFEIKPESGYDKFGCFTVKIYNAHINKI